MRCLTKPYYLSNRDRNTPKDTSLCKLYMSETDKDLNDMTIEEIVAFVESDKSSYKDNLNNLDKSQNTNTKSQRKKREDREYEAYWDKRNRSPIDGSKTAQLKQKAVMKAYYSINDESSSKNMEALSNFGNFESDKESRKKILTNGKSSASSLILATGEQLIFPFSLCSLNSLNC